METKKLLNKQKKKQKANEENTQKLLKNKQKEDEELEPKKKEEAIEKTEVEQEDSNAKDKDPEKKAADSKANIKSFRIFRRPNL